jgi:hypothetical protein
MKIPLNVSFEEKDNAKKIGAQWDTKYKLWYLWDYKKLPSVAKWLNPEYNIYITENVYLVTGFRQCWNCNKTTKVYSIGADKFVSFDDQWKFYSSFYLVNSIQLYSKNLTDILKLTDNKFKLIHSKTIDQTYLMNTCTFCDSAQGDNYLYYEDDSVFNPVGTSNNCNWNIKKTPIELDVGIKGNLFFDVLNPSNKILWNKAKHE